MAVTVTELVEYTTTDNGSSYSTGSYAPTASRGLVACILATATDHNLTPTVTGNGVTWGLQDAAARGAHAMWVFTADSGTSPTTTGLTVDLNPADPAIGILIWVGQLGNVDPDPATFFVQSEHGAFDADEQPVVSFGATTASDCATIGFLGAALNPAAQTPPTSWTEVCDTGITNPTVGITVAYYDSPGEISSVTWGSTPAAVSTLTIMEIAVGGAATIHQRSASISAVSAVTVVPTKVVIRTAAISAVSAVAIRGSVVGTPSRPSRTAIKRRKRWLRQGHVTRLKDAPRGSLE